MSLFQRSEIARLRLIHGINEVHVAIMRLPPRPELVHHSFLLRNQFHRLGSIKVYYLWHFLGRPPLSSKYFDMIFRIRLVDGRCSQVLHAFAIEVCGSAVAMRLSQFLDLHRFLHSPLFLPVLAILLLGFLDFRLLILLRSNEVSNTGFSHILVSLLLIVSALAQVSDKV